MSTTTDPMFDRLDRLPDGSLTQTEVRWLTREIRRLYDEMETVAVGLDLVIQGGCDQATNLGRLRDHLRAWAGQRQHQPEEG